MTDSVIHLFLNASLIVQIVIVLLLLASVFSWMVIFERWIYINKSKQELISFEEKRDMSMVLSPLESLCIPNHT